MSLKQKTQLYTGPLLTGLFSILFTLADPVKNESSVLLFSEVHTYIQNFTRVNKIEVIFFLRLCAAFHTSPLFIYVRKVYRRILPCPCFPSPSRSIHFGDVSKANACTVVLMSYLVNMSSDVM